MEGQSHPAAIAAAAAALSGADSAAARRQLALLYQKLPVDDRRYVSEADRDEIFKRLRKDNRMCFDCSSRNPTWISLTHAIYVCLNCSGKHRRLGTHLSFVRSTEMDKMYPEQLFRMELGGNRRAHDFLREHGWAERRGSAQQRLVSIECTERADLSQPLDYHGKLAAKHRQMLDRLVSSELQCIGWVTGTQQDGSGALQQKAALPAAASLHQQQQNQSMQDAQYNRVPSHGAPAAVAPPSGQYGQPLASAAVAPAAPAATPVAVPATPTGVLPNGVGGPSWGGPPIPTGTGRAVRSRKLEMDFDFEKEAALLAAKQRAAAQAPQSAAAPSQPPLQQQAAVQGAGSIGTAIAFGSAPRVSTNPGFACGGPRAMSSSAAAVGGYGSNNSSPTGGYGSNSQRFSGAKSISSAQFFNEEDAAPPVAAIPVDPTRRAIGSDEVFGRSSSSRRGWEDQSAARVEALRMQAQQGWQQLSQVGSDALSKAREWLAGT